MQKELMKSSPLSIFHIINACLGFLAIGLLVGGSMNTYDIWLQLVENDLYAYLGACGIAIISGLHACYIILKSGEESVFVRKQLIIALLFLIVGGLIPAMLSLLSLYYPHARSLGSLYYPVVGFLILGASLVPFLLTIGLLKIYKAHEFLKNRKLAVISANFDSGV